MLNRKIFTFFLLTFHLAIAILKPTDFCILKQKECKGFYDEQNNYEQKCETIQKCHGSFSFNCDLDICSKTKLKCKAYIFNNIIQSEFSKLAGNSIDRNKTSILKKQMKVCEKKHYEFKSNDFCLNGNNCIEIRKEIAGFGFVYRSLTKTRKIECQCPDKQRFKCDNKYCTTHSFACDFYKELKNKERISNKINNKFDNHTITSLRFNKI